MYSLIFDPNTVGRRNFEICYQAVVMTDKEVTRDNEDDFIVLLKMLKSISVEASEKIGRIPLRDLQEGGGSVMLERSVYKLLLALIERPIWRPIILEQKQEAYNWLKAIKPIEVKAPESKVAGSIAPAVGGPNPTTEE